MSRIGLTARRDQKRGPGLRRPFVRRTHPTDGEHSLLIKQGNEMGRPSRIKLSLAVASVEAMQSSSPKATSKHEQENKGLA